MMEASHGPLPAALHASITAAFPESPAAWQLVARWLGGEAESESWIDELLAVARGVGGASWSLRLLAVLLLEHALLALPPDDLDGHRRLFARLGVIAPDTEADFAAFLTAQRRKLQRLERMHRGIAGLRTSAAALGDFLHLAGQGSKLSLARYLFTPEEVVAQILTAVRTTRGVEDHARAQHPYIDEEAERALAALPAYEAAIVRALCARAEILWARPETSTAINALVEYPDTTVVLVIKPPGSTLELELKRAGQRLGRPLDIIYLQKRPQEAPTHRLDGGGTGWTLKWEAAAAAMMAKVFRLVHGREAPLSRTAGQLSVFGVPTADGEVHLLDYFTDAQTFGPGYGAMRNAMARAVKDLRAVRSWAPPEAKGEMGLTLQYINLSPPGQSLVVGTSSFRLDRLADYLAPGGAATYFQRCLGRGCSDDEARRFADDLLEELLGVYTPPVGAYRGHGDHVTGAFSMATNRQRADRIYLALLAQLGTYWGTLWGVGGYSIGESFVARNVGLRSIWKGERWQVEMRFMDHESLHIAGRGQHRPEPLGMLSGQRSDERFISGTPSGPRRQGFRSHLHCLDAIYRPADDLQALGRSHLQRALTRAHRKARRALATKPALRRLFHPRYAARLLAWDRIVARFLAAQGENEQQSWETESRRALAKQGLEPDQVKKYIAAVRRYEAFLRRFAFLYSVPSTAAQSRA